MRPYPITEDAHLQPHYSEREERPGSMSKTYVYIDEKNRIRNEHGKLLKPDKQGRYWIRVPKKKEPSDEELMFYWWRLVILLFYPVFWLRDVVLSVFGKHNYFERRIETLESFRGYLDKHERKSSN